MKQQIMNYVEWIEWFKMKNKYQFPDQSIIFRIYFKQYTGVQTTDILFLSTFTNELWATAIHSARSTVSN